MGEDASLRFDLEAVEIELREVCQALQQTGMTSEIAFSQDQIDYIVSGILDLSSSADPEMSQQ